MTLNSGPPFPAGSRWHYEFVRQDQRAPFEHALRRARESAYLPGEYVEQESFMQASEIRELARRAGIGAGTPVLDLCCGVAGPGRLIAQELGCAYLGVDFSASAIEIARARSRELPCRFDVRRIPPLPAGQVEVVLLLETMLAFADKDQLLREIAKALAPGGRFAFTFEEGAPLTAAERRDMPEAETVWLTPLDEMHVMLDRAGFTVIWQDEISDDHGKVAAALIDEFATDAADIIAEIGRDALEELLAGHRLWRDWLRDGRVRKFAVVATKRAA
jgi:SAM-dependent methyltransferase